MSAEEHRNTGFRRGISRRGFLRFAAVGAGAVGVGTLVGCSGLLPRSPLDTVGDVSFTNALPIPPLAEMVEENGRKVFALTIQEGVSSIVSQGDTRTWGLNGPFLGPTIRASRGDEVRVNLRNELPEMTTIHWHGMKVPSEADGGPHSPIDPGHGWSPEWTVDQPAATLWYHPHPHGVTEAHVYKGLGGFFIVDDEDEPGDLPHEYGVDDIPVIIQDKTFDEGGQLVETARQGVGMLGDTILTNGAAGATFEVTSERTRLRLLNGSTARSYGLGLSDGRSFLLIGTDGGLLPEPVELDRILLTPGERADVVVEMQPGEDVVMRSFPHDLGVNSGRARDAGAEDDLDIMQLSSAAELAPSPAIPATLATIPALSEGDATEVREFNLGNNVINSRPMDMERVDAYVDEGATEIWEVTNGHSQPHNFHIHDVQFQILDIDGEAPPPELAGWKDTIYTPPGARFRLIMRFGDNPTPEIPYMFHCHLLWHEDEGMMGQFTVGLPEGAEIAAADHEH